MSEEKEEVIMHDEDYANEMISWIDERILGIQEDKITIDYLQKVTKLHNKQIKNTIDSMSISVEYMNKQIMDDPQMPDNVKQHLTEQLELHAIIKE